MAALGKKAAPRPPAKRVNTPKSKKTTLQTDYNNAEKSYRGLVKSKKRSKRRDLWKQIINNFKKVYERDPGGAWAAAGLFRAGQCYLELHKHSFLGAVK